MTCEKKFLGKCGEPNRLASCQDDLCLFDHIVADAWKTMFAKVKIWKWKANVDTFYGESPDKQAYMAYETECYIDNKPGWDPVMVKAGRDEFRELDLHFSQKLLRDNNYEPPTIGDLVEIENQMYEFVDVNPLDNFANQEYQLGYTCHIQLYHHDRDLRKTRGKSIT